MKNTTPNDSIEDRVGALEFVVGEELLGRPKVRRYKYIDIDSRIQYLESDNAKLREMVDKLWKMQKGKL